MSTALSPRAQRACAGGIAAALSLALAACGSPGQAADGDEVISLRYATAFGPGDTPYDEPAEWIRRVSERVVDETGYTLDVKVFPKSQLVPINEMLPAVQDGRADISIVSVGLFPGELPLNQITSVPFLSDNALDTMRSMAELSESNDALKAEWEHNRVVPVLWVAAENAATSSAQPISSLEDLDGLKIRAIGLQAEALKDAGASVVALPSEEVYDSLSRGVIDAFSGSPLSTQVTTYHIQEIAPNFVDLGLGQYSSAIGVLFNEKKWDALPSEVQAIMREEAEAVVSDFTPQNLATVHGRICAAIAEAGGNVARLSDSDISAWRDLSAARTADIYVQQAVDAGQDEATVRGLLDDYAAAIERHSANSTGYVDGLRACG